MALSLNPDATKSCKKLSSHMKLKTLEKACTSTHSHLSLPFIIQISIKPNYEVEFSENRICPEWIIENLCYIEFFYLCLKVLTNPVHRIFTVIKQRIIIFPGKWLKEFRAHYTTMKNTWGKLIDSCSPYRKKQHFLLLRHKSAKQCTDSDLDSNLAAMIFDHGSLKQESFMQKEA